jgi:pimeloyl-ACP methyl ester carboxylesterase
MIYRPQIMNPYGERLDALVEEREKTISSTVILVHGLGTDKHESHRYFDDLSFGLQKNFRVVRFDFSACGVSDGRFEEKDFEKWAEDLKAVVNVVKKKYPGKIHILAQSLGCFVAAQACPEGIEKAVFTGLPNSNVNFLIDKLVYRFESRDNARIDFEGISIIPRTTGKNQLIGPTFWRVFRLFNPVRMVTRFAQKTKLLIVHPKQDEVVGHEYLSQYAKIPGVEATWLNGDHSFKNAEDRQALIQTADEFLMKSV